MKHSSPFVHLYECCIQKRPWCWVIQPSIVCLLTALPPWNWTLESLTQIWVLVYMSSFFVSFFGLPWFTNKAITSCHYYFYLFVILFAYYAPMLLLLQQNLGLHLKPHLGTLKMLLQVGVFGASSITYHPTLKIKRLTMYVWFHVLYFCSIVIP